MMSATLVILGTVVAIVIVAAMVGLAALLFLQSAIALYNRRPADRPDADAVRPRTAVLVPAHNEADGIGATLASLVPQLGAGDRLVVIADNCSDHTAQVVTALGVTVIERIDTRLRGKGHALDFGIRHLAADPPDVVLMFDADCVAGPDTLRILAIEAGRSRRPVQALYLIRATDRSVPAMLAEFAQRLRNWVRPLGMKAVGLPCQLMGSGMGFHWSLFDRQSVASGHLTEDLQLGLAFARQGLYPVFCPEATVDSRAVSDVEGARVQRTRWEHGHLGTIVAEWPRLALLAVRKADLRLASMAWDLAVPPLALYASLLLAFASLAVVVASLGGPLWPLAGLSVAIAMLLLTIVMAQRGFGRDLIRLRDIFFALPLYLIRKAPVYFRFLFRRQVEWVRTKRDEG